jgi:hypothetical protein
MTGWAYLRGRSSNDGPGRTKADSDGRGSKATGESQQSSAGDCCSANLLKASAGEPHLGVSNVHREVSSQRDWES